MHMSDAFLSPVVGGSLWAFTALVGSHCVQKSKALISESSRMISLTGVTAAFIFAAQMINFTIPGTGASGHLSGGLFLTLLLGPYLSFLAMASILLIQALFFADGGILALGANLINMTFFMNFIAYPLIYKTVMQRGTSRKSLYLACILTAVAGLQMGSMGVVFQTLLSGRVSLPGTAFLILMQSIHLAIGIIEGLITAVLVSYLSRHAPEFIDRSREQQASSPFRERLIGILAAGGLLCAGFFSLFASNRPDGLEWSLEKVSSSLSWNSTGGVLHQWLGRIQEGLSFLPDYAFQDAENGPRSGTILAGLSGVILTTLLLVLLLGALRALIRRRRRS